MDNFSVGLYTQNLLSSLSEIEINEAIIEYKKNNEFIEENEEDLRYFAVYKLAKNKFNSLDKQVKEQYKNDLIESKEQIIISYNQGQINISTMYGQDSSFIGQSKNIYDKNSHCLY